MSKNPNQPPEQGQVSDPDQSIRSQPDSEQSPNSQVQPSGPLASSSKSQHPSNPMDQPQKSQQGQKTQQAKKAQTQKADSKVKFQPEITEEQLKTYYRDHFDTNLLWKVMDKGSFPRREFGFDRVGHFFTRNKSFANPSDLKEYMSIYATKAAYAGAIYADPVRTKTKKYNAFTIHDTEWMGRELIFDLDANDYDPVRQCDCKGRDVCEICWGLIQDAAVIMDETLRVDFGFKKLQWVFTGGRGYHCWVLDRETLTLSQEQRSGLVNYMQLIHDPGDGQRVEKITNSSVLLNERIVRLLTKRFVLESRPIVLEEIGIKKTARATMIRKLKEKNYKELIDIIPRKVTYEQFFEQMVKYRYARIDHKVTIDTRRLIRLPGSVHSHTGYVGQYIDNPESFFPEDAKHIQDITG